MEAVKKFVIQKHYTTSGVHWDLMFEAGTVLETYRLELPPEKLSSQKKPAVKIFDHPLKFLTYEGSVNQGKGRVEIADAGAYQLLSQSETHKEMQINGKILKGRFTLTHIKENQWEFTPASS
jgi:bifunctional non-homologous end joining protein LigD